MDRVEFVRSVRRMLAYERADDGALVLAAGVPAAWLDGGVVVEGFGDLVGTGELLMRRDGTHALRIDTAPGLTVPPGGVVINVPLSARPLVRVEVDGEPLKAFDTDGARLPRWP